MLTHVYIRGNVGDPRNLKIFDLNTDVLVPDVRKFTIVADVAGVVQAELIRTQHPDVVVTVEAGPKNTLAGERMYRFRMETEHNPILCATMQKAHADEFIVDDYGQLSGGRHYQINHGVSDTDLFSFASVAPLDLIQNSMERAMRDLYPAVTHSSITAAVRKITKAGGVRSLVGGGGGARVLTGAVAAAAPCPECFGTGLKGGFMQPCSRGCSP